MRSAQVPPAQVPPAQVPPAQVPPGTGAAPAVPPPQIPPAPPGGLRTREPVTDRSFFDRPVLDVATALLRQVIEHETDEGLVAVEITEVEAYAGAVDPASHAYRGPTPRNEVMFGPPGHAYVYFTYGMHFCVNLVCLGEGVAAAVLLRAGRVLCGAPLARTRRRVRASERSKDQDLARGPARLCQAMGIGRALNGADVCDPVSPLRLRLGETVSPRVIRSGPRTGVRAGADAPWRFWLAGEPTVSPYRAYVPRSRAGR